MEKALFGKHGRDTPPNWRPSTASNGGELADIDRLLVQRRVLRRLTGRASEPVALGHFELRRGLGRGGMGVVYEAIDRRTGRLVALKGIPELDAHNVSRIKREFRHAVDLCHPNLVSVFELFECDGNWFFSMELVRGRRFDEYVRDAEGASVRDALRQLVAGVSHVHGKGKLHGDLKSSNVLVTGSGRVVILDLGLAREATPSTLSRPAENACAGTVGYLSPEQLQGQEPKSASDWYAVGVMLFKAMFGRTPAAARAERSADLQKLTLAVPPPLARICAGLLCEGPAYRFDAREVLRELDGWSGERQETTRHLPTPTEPGRSTQRALAPLESHRPETPSTAPRARAT